MNFETLLYDVDLCVVGGGLSGMCAAIAAARNGAKTLLMQERPVLGGNASSEIRMWVCGAGGSNNRETGILEEIQLESLYRNPYKIYSVWDSILYEKVKFEKNITLILNCSCCDAEMDNNKIVSVTGWQMTTQKWIKVKAKYFSDCSGDSVLAPLTGAEFRVGRESKYEFNEIISEETPDSKTMGMSCLIQARKGTVPVSYKAPEWAVKLTDDDVKFRNPDPESTSQNYWYLELGGDVNSIDDTEKVRDELLALAYGTWDYVKNSGKYKDADLWQLDFVGFLPGKRESRRMMGEYLMTQLDVTSGGKFEDIVAYGGWPLDDHDPGGFRHTGHPNTNVGTPSPYGIPYRTLYSKNIENLYFAGRNISMTHAAMSSSRVMATCALLGQAAGTAAAIASKYGISPHTVYTEHLNELKQTLMYDDSFLPYNKREVGELALNAALTSDGEGNIENLRNGIDRNNHTYGSSEQGYMLTKGGFAEYAFEEPAEVENVRIVFDSDLDRTTLDGDGCERGHTMRANVTPESPVMCVPKTLVKDFRIEVRSADGTAENICVHENHKRLCIVPIGRKAVSVKLIVNETWGAENAHVFSFDLK